MQLEVGGVDGGVQQVSLHKVDACHHGNDKAQLDETILRQGHKGNWCCGDEDACNQETFLTKGADCRLVLELG